MAGATFCTLEDVEAREPNIQDLASDSGNINIELAAARQEIEDTLITSGVLRDLDKLGPDIKPRQFRLPAIFKTLEIIYFANAKDEDSPYFVKYKEYELKYQAAMSAITHFDIDSDEDGVLEDDEQSQQRIWTGRMKRV